MNSRVEYLSKLRFAIIAETKTFLRALQTGASDEKLRTIAKRIRDQEQELLQQEGVVLDPTMWRILHSRMSRRSVEFADSNN